MVRRAHTPNVRRSGVRRLCNFLPQCHLRLFQPSSHDFFMPWLHSITRNRQGTFSQSEYLQPLGKLASQDIGSVLTMLAPLAHRAELRSFGHRLTRHGTRVNYACPLRLPFTLDIELGRKTVFHSDLTTLVLHTLVETSLVARISPKPKPQRQGKIALHLLDPSLCSFF